jgi:periplasmic copper chaperone A
MEGEMSKFIVAISASIPLLMAAGTFASAHAVLDVKQATANSSYKGAIQISHGCKGSATTSIRAQIPEGLIGVKPMPKAGWSVATVRGPYAKTYDFYHGQLKEGVKEIVWSGGKLPDDFADEFLFRGHVSSDAVAGAALYVPIVQECETGTNNWVEIPKAGQSASELKAPAPFIKIAVAEAAKEKPSAMAGKLRIEQPWSRATPGGAKVAGGYLRITNTGAEIDRLIGGSADIAGRFEMHEMKTENGVMTMRQLASGLEIKPGETVELKPGGYHLMFMDLKTPVVQGKPIKGTLVFERAGTVSVEYDVAPIGAGKPASGGHGEHSGHGKH